MADDSEQPPSAAEVRAKLESWLSGLDSADALAVLGQLAAQANGLADPGTPEPVPSRRRRRRDDVVTYRVRIDLKETAPPAWRRLELASDLSLDGLHEIIQLAFGWTDSHLHRFGSGPSYYSRETEYYLSPYEAAEGDQPGVPEEEVRLDEVLVDVGDQLFYLYDFGDDWEHVIKLEAVLPRAESAPPAVCTAGRRPGPSEDCGGVGMYELLDAATDPTRDNHAEAIAEYKRLVGDEIDPNAYAPTRFEIDEINSALAMVIAGADLGELPQPMTDLLAAIQIESAGRWLRRLIVDAMSDEPLRIDPDTAARMVHPYAWLLDRVGADGIKLTGAGYLPPTEVEAAVAELGLAREWIGKGNREIQTLPVLELRESAQKLGLLRKYRGRLIRTPRGREVCADPVALWWQLAERMPLESTAAYEVQAGLTSLIALAAGITDVDAAVADILQAIGWVSEDDDPVDVHMAYSAMRPTDAVLRRIGCFTEGERYRRSTTLTADGMTFVRAAVRTWPDGR